MSFEAVKAWLIQQNTKQIRFRWLLALLALLLIPVGVTIGGAIVYFFILKITNGFVDPHMLKTALWITVGIMASLFIINLFTPRTNDPEKYYQEESEEEDEDYQGFAGHEKAKAKVIFWIALTGPRLLDWAIFSFKEIRRLKRQDTHSCAAMLWVMVTKRSKVPYDAFPLELDWLDVEATLPQLKCISGVLFLRNPPPGLSLTEDLRNAIQSGETSTY